FGWTGAFRAEVAARARSAAATIRRTRMVTGSGLDAADEDSRARVDRLVGAGGGHGGGSSCGAYPNHTHVGRVAQGDARAPRQPTTSDPYRSTSDRGGADHVAVKSASSVVMYTHTHRHPWWIGGVY